MIGKFMTEKEFRNEMREVRLKNESNLRKYELKTEKNKYKPQRKKVQTTKIITALLMIFLLLNCIAVEIYAMYAMFVLRDLSALYVLIGAACTTVIGEVLAFAVYSAKSYKETKAEKDLEFEYHKLELQNQTSICDKNSDESEPVG